MNHLFFTKFLPLFIVFYLIPSTTRSQALILEEGQKSTHIGAGFATMDDLRNAFLFASYSPSNKLTMGLDVFRSTLKNEDDLSQIGLAPHISYYFVRASEQSPVSVGLLGAYARSVVRSDYLKSLGIDISENTYRGSLLAAWHASQGKKSKVILQGNVGYTYSQVDASDGLFDYESTDEGISGSIGCLFSLAAGENAFNIVPSILIGEDDFGFGLYLGYSLIK